MESEDVDNVLKEISSITERYDANELNSVASVYDKKEKKSSIWKTRSDS